MESWQPIGPATLTGIDDSDLAVETRLNGELVQNGRTSDPVNDVPNLVSYIGRYVTLRPADVVEVEIEGLGVRGNRIVAMGELRES